jgi:hypothetical protein
MALTGGPPHDPTGRLLRRLRSFALPMNPELPAVDAALPALRALMRDAGVAFKLVGGVAVVHHGYARTTEDVDVLRAARHRDLADVVELLKRVNEGQYLELEAEMAGELRPRLAALREDALAEET